MSSLPSTTTPEPEGMRSGSTSVRMSTFPVNEHEKWVSCDEQKGNLALFIFCDICFFIFFNRHINFPFFSCSHGTCLAGVTEPLTPAGHGTSASTEMWSPFTPPDGHAPEVNKRWDDFVYQGRETWIFGQVQCFTQKIAIVTPIKPSNLKFILEFDAV